MKKLTQIIFVLFFINTSTFSYAQPDHPKQQAVATAHPLATLAGERILKQGGNAFDASIAITAALAVVEPYSSGLGGGGFWMLHQASSNKTIFIDGREKAPMAATTDMYLDSEGNYIKNSSVNGALAAAIPGTVAALEHLSKHYGKLSLQQCLQPAIDLAKNGFKVTKHYQQMVSFRLELLNQYPVSSKIFLSKNKVPKIGELIIQTDLAKTLEKIALQGKKGFYQGEIAQLLVDAVQQAGGIWSLNDLLNYQIIERQPIKFNYKGMTIYSAPPPSSGGIALNTILNILKNYPLQQLSAIQQKHLIVEAMRRAYHDRAQYLGDSDFIQVPTKKLSSIYYAAGLAASIHPKKATPSELLSDYKIEIEGNDTTHFVVLDKEGNCVSSTMSINYPFGSGFTASGTGILLNDEMDDFSVKPGQANVYGLVGAKANEIIAQKRPLSSMSPTYIEYKTDTEQGIALIGTPGGSRIITMVLLGLLDIFKDKNPDSWVNLPRFHHQYLPDFIYYENDTFNAMDIKKLEQMGHSLKLSKHPYGNMQALWWDQKTGEVNAASDQRGEGKAITFPPSP
ncbi:MAG: gamma-glutamyltransferase [Pseudomonadota bacterium]